MTVRRFPSPWTVERLPGGFKVIDASGQVLGRVATVTVRLLQGKHTASYPPVLDSGDHVVILNDDLRATAAEMGSGASKVVALARGAA